MKTACDGLINRKYFYGNKMYIIVRMGKEIKSNLNEDTITKRQAPRKIQARTAAL